jgi:hypothetical protein
MTNVVRVPPPPPPEAPDGVKNTWFNRVHDAISRLNATIVTYLHNDLTGLQGGSTAERYHLDLTQYSAVGSFDSTKWTDLTDGGTTSLHKHSLHATASLNFGSIAANATAELTMTVTGAVAGAAVYLGPPTTIEPDLVWCGYVSATDTVTIRIHNAKGTSVDPAAATWHARVEID